VEVMLSPLNPRVASLESVTGRPVENQVQQGEGLSASGNLRRRDAPKPFHNFKCPEGEGRGVTEEVGRRRIIAADYVNGKMPKRSLALKSRREGEGKLEEGSVGRSVRSGGGG